MVELAALQINVRLAVGRCPAPCLQQYQWLFSENVPGRCQPARQAAQQARAALLLVAAVLAAAAAAAFAWLPPAAGVVDIKIWN